MLTPYAAWPYLIIWLAFIAFHVALQYAIAQKIVLKHTLIVAFIIAAMLCWYRGEVINYYESIRADQVQFI